MTNITDFSTHLVLTGVAVLTLLAGSSLRTNRPDGIGYEVSGSTMAVVSLLVASADVQALAIASLFGAVGAAIVALRPDRRIVGTAAAITLALVALWTELAVHKVRTVEPYTMPLAVALLGVGFWWRRTHRETTNSWAAYGMGLAIGLFPTVLLSIGNDDTLRLILGACGAVIVLLVGAQTRLRASIVVAASALAVLGGDQLINVAMQIPRWVTFAALGALCVGLGATADRQLNNVRRIRRTLHEMQ